MTLWLRLSGQASEARLPAHEEIRPLAGRAAVLVPAWHEAKVIGQMIRHTLAVWPQLNWMLYVGCYRNDPDTGAAAMQGAGNDPRVRLIVHDCGIM